MAQHSPFSEWLDREKAPLGMALQRIVDRNTIASLIVVEQNASAPDACSAEDDGEYVDALPPELIDELKTAIKELMSAIGKGDLPVYGLGKEGGPAKEVPIGWFDECFIKVSHLESDSQIFDRVFKPVKAARIFLEFGTTYENWPECDGDILWNDDQIAWSHLVAPTQKIKELWPIGGPNEISAFHALSPASVLAAKTIYKTGTAGKPSAWWLVEQEIRRRFADFPPDIKKTDIAKSMCRWIKENHPEAPPIGDKTISNNLTSLLIELKESRKSA